MTNGIQNKREHTNESKGLDLINGLCKAGDVRLIRGSYLLFVFAQDLYIQSLPSIHPSLLFFFLLFLFRPIYLFPSLLNDLYLCLSLFFLIRTEN